MTKPARNNVEIYFAALALAKKHYGYEDILVKLKLPRTPEYVDWVKRIVFGRENMSPKTAVHRHIAPDMSTEAT